MISRKNIEKTVSKYIFWISYTLSRIHFTFIHNWIIVKSHQLVKNINILIIHYNDESLLHHIESTFVSNVFIWSYAIQMLHHDLAMPKASIGTPSEVLTLVLRSPGQCDRKYAHTRPCRTHVMTYNYNKV